MFEFLASTFGYLLQFLYNLVNNYGIAIILFTITIKIILLPLSIKQQKTMKKSAKMQEKIKVIQFKYKNDQEKMNQEMMNLYKSENMSPISGCLTTIIQMLYNYLKELNPEDENVDKLNLQMNFLGLDLSKIPQQNMSDYTVYIIPVLYILSSFVSIRLTTSMQTKKKVENKDITIDGKTGEKLELEESKNNEPDSMAQTNKIMSWMMPILSISIAFVAPLGLALYWLINNVLMIIERLVLDKVLKES